MQCYCPVYYSHDIRCVEKSGRKNTECLHFLHLYIEKPGWSEDFFINSGLAVISSCRQDSWTKAVIGHLQDMISLVQVQAVLEHFLHMKRLLLACATCFKVFLSSIYDKYYKGSGKSLNFNVLSTLIKKICEHRRKQKSKSKKNLIFPVSKWS